MGPQDVAALLSAIAWPTTVLVAVLLFRTPLHNFLEQLANSVKLSMVKIRLGTVELELPIEQASAILNEMQKEITDALGLLSDDEVALFKKIAKEEGRATVNDLSDGDFIRGVSPEHDQLRHLRDWRLIDQRTAEGAVTGKWRGDNYPCLTPFGRLALSLDRRGRNDTASRPTSKNTK